MVEHETNHCLLKGGDQLYVVMETLTRGAHIAQEVVLIFAFTANVF